MEAETQLKFMLLGLWFLPLVGFLLNGVAYPALCGGYAKTKASVAGWIASVTMLISFALSVVAVCRLAQGPIGMKYLPLYTFLESDFLKVSLSFYLDHLSSLMILIITGIGSLIHIYSISYMHHEKNAARFFAYLNLFCFAMLLLVLSDNLLFVFFGWEGVGLCSYLLIGYWYEKEANVAAARKAFLVNRVGDFAFLLALGIIALTFQTLAINPFIMAATKGAGLSLIGILLFFAATGKSAQLPLYVWLPDAMAGPTPVSALIHAATMVTAGVYLFARLSPFFEQLPSLMMLVAWVGALTALFAATIALVQNDIKKVLAYSTVSQLGYMFLALGVGAYPTAMLHLMTHAFFKALLFLGAGSLIHGCGGEQNMEQMGGLRKQMPTTFKTMLVGAAALVGLPFFSGFFSKDAILHAALTYPRGGVVLFAIAAIAAFLTALYCWRMIHMVFLGQARSHAFHAHESDGLMLWPLRILAVGAAFSGFLGIDEEWGPNLLAEWLRPSLAQGQEHILPVSAVLTSMFAVLVAVLGLYLSYTLCRKKFSVVGGPIGRLLAARYFVDEVYVLLFVKPYLAFSSMTQNFFEMRLIASLHLLLRKTSDALASYLRRASNGDLQWYAFYLGLGLAVMVGIVMATS